MANLAAAPQTVNSTLNQNDVQKEKEKTEQVPVTIVVDKESAAILRIETVKVISLAFSLQEQYDNASQYQKDALQDAAVMFLKSQCQRTIATWDNLVTRFGKTKKYENVGRLEIEKSLKDNPKTRPFWNAAEKAIAIKKMF